jgi:hypothetical protein
MGRSSFFIKHTPKSELGQGTHSRKGLSVLVDGSKSVLMSREDLGNIGVGSPLDAEKGCFLKTTVGGMVCQETSPLEEAGSHRVRIKRST